MQRPVALVVDEDPAVRRLVREVFEQGELSVLEATDGSDTVELLGRGSVAIVVVNVRTSGVSHRDLMRGDPSSRSSPVVIAVAPVAEASRATELIKAGAFDVLFEPLDRSRLEQVVERARRQHALLLDLRRLRDDLQGREGYQGLVGRSAAMERLREQLQQLASGDGPVCFVGETGTGKELAARTLHRLSAAAEGPFVTLHCATLTESAWEARWLGGGSGDHPDSRGVLGQARGGVLYLEELPELALGLQEKLLKTLGIGADPGWGPSGPPPDLRILSSSLQDPLQAVDEGRLLEPLRRKLIVETVQLPPLRERLEDIALMARHFITTICEINKLPEIQLSGEALALLERYHWPANVHELRNAMEQAVILSADGNVRPRDLPDRIREAGAVGQVRERSPEVSTRRFRDAKREVVEAFERSYLHTLMERHGGNVTAASQQAGMLRSALQRLLRKYGFKSAEFRRARRAARTEDSTRSRVD